MTHESTVSKRRAALQATLLGLVVLVAFGLILAGVVWKEWSILETLQAEGTPATAKVATKAKERVARGVYYVVTYEYLADKPPYPGMDDGNSLVDKFGAAKGVHVLEDVYTSLVNKPARQLGRLRNDETSLVGSPVDRIRHPLDADHIGGRAGILQSHDDHRLDDVGHSCGPTATSTAL